MKYVFVIEDEYRFQKEIFDSLTQIDPKLTPRFFSSLDLFSSFIHELVQSGPVALHKSGLPYNSEKPEIAINETEESSLAMVICKEEIIGGKHMELLEKARGLFIRKKVCTAEDPTAFVITAFDRPEFKIKKVEKNFINNVIFKPFDNLILQQHLFAALTGRHQIKSNLVYTMKTQVKVEMIKDVSTESFSDIGFVTRSPREIKIGHISKYYGDLFSASRRNYIFARCWKSEKHPEIPDHYRSWFTFFASESTSHTDFRRKLSMLKAPEIKMIRDNPDPKACTIALIDSQDAKRKEMKANLEKQLKNTQVIEYSNWEDFVMHVDPSAFESNQKAECWSGVEPQAVILDSSGRHIIAFDPPLAEGKTFLGLSIAEAQKIDFSKIVTEASQTAWLKQFVSKKSLVGIDSLIQVRTNQGKFLLKCAQISEERSENQILTGLRFIFKKPPTDEKAAWYQQVTSIKNPIHMVMCPLDYITKQEPTLWTSLLETLEKKAGQPISVIAMNEELADETTFGRLPQWLFDIYYAQHDKTELFRKIAFLTGRGADPDFKFFLTDQEIRVANPIEIQELSETHLVVRYHRALTLGSFRKFVLPKATGDTVLEYLGACNFAEEDPGEGEGYLNHFVFFGIRDLFLKNIRVWIRDNYALEKEKAAG